MANRYWVASGAGNWNDTANWSTSSGGGGGASVPGVSDDVIFDGSGVGNAITDIAINIASLNVQSGYSGYLDLADSSYSHAIGGNVTLDGSGTIDFGNSTTTISGDFDYKDQSTLTDGNSTIILNGTSKTLNPSNSYLYNLIISGTYSTPVTDAGVWIRIDRDLTIQSSASLELNRTGIFSNGITFNNDGTIYLGSGLASYILFRSSTLNGGLGTFVDNGATASAEIRFEAHNTIDGASTYPIRTGFDALWAAPYIIDFVGTQIFEDDVLWMANTGEESVLSPGTADIIFQGDLTREQPGTHTWIKGTGTITFFGSSNQSLDFGGNTIDDIVVDKASGIAILTGGFTTDSLSVNRGELDIDGQTVNVSGDMTSNPIAGAVTISDTAATGSISITGNIDLNGTATYGITWTDADIDTLAAGINEADYTDVTDSNNSSGNDIVVTNGTVTNSPGWISGGAPPSGRYMFRGPF